MLILLIGDLHIPHRAVDLPAKFKKLLVEQHVAWRVSLSLYRASHHSRIMRTQVPGKVQQILCTGNITDKDTYDLLRSIASDVVCVRGDMDDQPPLGSALPERRVISIGALKIGLVHGHQR